MSRLDQDNSVAVNLILFYSYCCCQHQLCVPMLATSCVNTCHFQCGLRNICHLLHDASCRTLVPSHSQASLRIVKQQLCIQRGNDWLYGEGIADEIHPSPFLLQYSLRKSY